MLHKMSVFKKKKLRHVKKQEFNPHSVKKKQSIETISRFGGRIEVEF